MREQTITAALRNAQLAGTLVAVSECERRCTEVGRSARDRVRVALRNDAERLATITDPRAMMIALDDLVDGVFVLFAKDVADGMLDAPDASEDAELETLNEAQAALDLAAETEDA